MWRSLRLVCTGADWESHRSLPEGFLSAPPQEEVQTHLRRQEGQQELRSRDFHSFFPTAHVQVAPQELLSIAALRQCSHQVQQALNRLRSLSIFYPQRAMRKKSRNVQRTLSGRLHKSQKKESCAHPFLNHSFSLLVSRIAHEFDTIFPTVACSTLHSVPSADGA